ncbi:MAG: hypothetical protein JWL72_4448 [Ilumatobacteraceae bacterium]|nr:hypothetical protein [Ilumatobacteraceae bacterium]
MSMKRSSLSEGRAPGDGQVAGWYPDPTDPRGLRYWDGTGWTDHRAQLAAPAASAAVCGCGVAATGTCRVCNLPFCRAHVSDQPREDRAYRKRWNSWMCGSCIEDGRRQLRAEQLARCESVAPRMASLGRIRGVRTFTGLRPRRANLFGQTMAGRRAVRAAKAYLIEYDAGEENSTYQGLAMSKDGTTIYEVGAPTRGVASARMGPKPSRSGYELRSTVSIELLRAAESTATSDNWFEHAARAFLRAARRLKIEPDLSPRLPRTELPTDDAIDATSSSPDDAAPDAAAPGDTPADTDTATNATSSATDA